MWVSIALRLVANCCTSFIYYTYWFTRCPFSGSFWGKSCMAGCLSLREITGTMCVCVCVCVCVIGCPPWCQWSSHLLEFILSSCTLIWLLTYAVCPVPVNQPWLVKKIESYNSLFLTITLPNFNEFVLTLHFSNVLLSRPLCRWCCGWKDNFHAASYFNSVKLSVVIDYCIVDDMVCMSVLQRTLWAHWLLMACKSTDWRMM